MKFAVIGSAHPHIREFIRDMLRLDGDFAGIYQDHSDLCAELAREYQVPVYDHLDDLFAQGIRLAGTTAVNSQKIEIIEKCQARGVHIMADKPIVISRSQYDRLQKIMKTGKIEVGMMLTERFLPSSLAVKKLLDQGTLGQIVNVEMLNPHRLIAATRPQWHFDKSWNGGILIDLMVHSVDLFRWLTGSEIIDFQAVVQKTILPEKKDFFDSAQALVQGSRGAGGYFRVDWHMPDSHWTWGDMRLFIIGTKGCVEVRGTGDPIQRRPIVVLYKDGQETAEIDCLEDEQQSVTFDFVNRIEKKDHCVTHFDILEASRICLDFDEKAQSVNFFEI